MFDKAAASGKERKPRQMPSSFTILFGCLLLVAIASWVVSSFSPDVQAATLGNFMASPFLGFESAMQVCVFILVLGGFLGVVTATGALNVGIDTLVRKLRGKEIWIIPILMILFSVGGTVYGMGEETVPFYILLASTMVAAGFDSMVGVGTVLLGAGCGVLGSTVNPFAVGVAVDALKTSGVEANQAIIIVLGAILWIVATAMAIVFMMRYAKKVKADKGSTILSLSSEGRPDRLRHHLRGHDRRLYPLGKLRHHRIRWLVERAHRIPLGRMVLR